MAALESMPALIHDALLYAAAVVSSDSGASHTRPHHTGNEGGVKPVPHYRGGLPTGLQARIVPSWPSAPQ